MRAYEAITELCKNLTPLEIRTGKFLKGNNLYLYKTTTHACHRALLFFYENREIITKIT